MLLIIKHVCDEWSHLGEGSCVAYSSSSADQECACGHFVEPQLVVERLTAITLLLLTSLCFNKILRCNL